MLIHAYFVQLDQNEGGRQTKSPDLSGVQYYA